MADTAFTSFLLVANLELTYLLTSLLTHLGLTYVLTYLRPYLLT